MDTALPDDKEIALKLHERTTEELLAFQKKLKLMKHPQATAIRFHLVRELLARHLGITRQIREMVKP